MKIIHLVFSLNRERQKPRLFNRTDGLLIRDGSEMKVKDILPLNPYLIWTATAEELDLVKEEITPKRFAEKADAFFQEHFGSLS